MSSTPFNHGLRTLQCVGLFHFRFHLGQEYTSPVLHTNTHFQEDVLRLVELTEDIKRDRRERIREIEAEREMAERQRRPLALPPAPWDEERVVEREIIYDRGPPPPRRYR